MASHRNFCWISILGATLCLAAGYRWIGVWVALGAGLANLVAWGIALRRRSEWSIQGALLVSTALFAVELLAGASIWLALPGAVFSLVSMDLAALDQAFAGRQAAGDLLLLQRKHYQALGLAVGIGLATAVAGMTIHLNISFIGMVILVLAALTCLEQVRRNLSG